jgi:uncharacterized protein (TIGR00303 family)
MIQTLTGTVDFIESLRGKTATFILAMSNTDTAKIDGITQAGIPGLIHLTPTLDAEFVCTGEVRSLSDLAQTPQGVPSPALITRSIHTLKPFRHIELFDLGVEVPPKLDYIQTHNFNLQPSGSIDKGAKINAIEIFEHAVEFGQNYECDSDYIIIAESVPSGTTTAEATARALGYEVEGLFSSSFKDVPNSIRQSTIQKALQNIDPNDELFAILSQSSDNMLIFNAGFILGLNNKIPTILAGGTQMASVLLIINKILQVMEGSLDTSNLSLCTTQWIANDKNSDIKGLLELLSFPINSYYTDFDFSMSEHPALKLYDEGEAKEGVGAGGALVYGAINGLHKEQITRQIESFLG